MKNLFVHPLYRSSLRSLLKIGTTFFVLITAICSWAQPSTHPSIDVNLWLGAGSYIGDIQTQFENSISPEVGGFLRCNFSPRMSARLQAITGKIKGGGTYNNHPVSFSKNMTHTAALFELNFFKYSQGKEGMSFTPYLLAGIGLSYYEYEYNYAKLGTIVDYLRNTSSNDILGLSVNYRRNKVEATVPVGIGFKTSLKKNIGIGAELLLFKHFDDSVDDLDDPAKYYKELKTPVTSERDVEWVTSNSLWRNNDYSMYFGIYLTYKFTKKKHSCPAF